MDILYIMIPIAGVISLVVAGVFLWAVNTKQFADLERQAQEVLDDDH